MSAAADTTTETAELQELRARVQALEERLGRLGQADDDTYPYLCAREFQLQGEQGELRGSMVVGDDGLARMGVYGGEPGKTGEPHAASFAADADGALFALINRDTGVRLMAQLEEDGSPRMKFYGASGQILIELVAFDTLGGVHLLDSQGRDRMGMLVGGEEDDPALFFVMDGDGNDGLRLLVPPVGEESGSATVQFRGWPDWISSSVKKLWERVHVLEERLGGGGGLSA